MFQNTPRGMPKLRSPQTTLGAMQFLVDTPITVLIAILVCSFGFFYLAGRRKKQPPTHRGGFVAMRPSRNLHVCRAWRTTKGVPCPGAIVVDLRSDCARKARQSDLRSTTLLKSLLNSLIRALMLSRGAATMDAQALHVDGALMTRLGVTSVLGLARHWMMVDPCRCDVKRQANLPSR